MCVALCSVDDTAAPATDGETLETDFFGFCMYRRFRVIIRNVSGCSQESLELLSRRTCNMCYNVVACDLEAVEITTILCWLCGSCFGLCTSSDCQCSDLTVKEGEVRMIIQSFCSQT